jgi:hypothetical protein
MPDTSNTTTPAAAPKGSRSASPGAADRSLEALKAAAAVVVDAKAETVAKGIRDDLEKFVALQLPKTDKPEPEICSSPKPKIAPFCSQRKLAVQQADLTFESSKETASATLRTALGAWRMALSQYDLSLAQAEADLSQAVAAAVSAYVAAFNDDSNSREWYLYYTMKLAIVEALQAYQGSAAAAADTLAAAAGTLIAASQSYADSIAAAQCQRLVDDATAYQTFWQSVEATLDAV